MKKIGDIALTVLVTLVMTLFFNSLLTEIFGAQGHIAYGQTIVAGGRKYFPIQITNTENQSMDGVTISLPAYVKVEEISATQAVSIERVDSTTLPNNKQIVLLSELPPRKVTRLLIPVASDETSACCALISKKGLRLRQIDDEDIPNPIEQTIRDVLVSAATYAALLAALLLWQRSRIQDLNEHSKRNEARLREAREEVREVKKDLTDIKVRDARYRAIILKRLDDYRQELNFWRDTLRKILYEQTKDSRFYETIIRKVTDGLGTFGTRASVDLTELDDLVTAISMEKKTDSTT